PRKCHLLTRVGVARHSPWRGPGAPMTWRQVVAGVFACDRVGIFHTPGAEQVRAMKRRPGQAGFTLVAMLVTVSVACALLTSAVPDMQQMMLRRQLEGAASEMYNNLLMARSQAVEKNRSAFVSFRGGGTDWIYGLDDVDDCNPAVGGSCTVNDAERV